VPLEGQGGGAGLERGEGLTSFGCATGSRTASLESWRSATLEASGSRAARWALAAAAELGWVCNCGPLAAGPPFAAGEASAGEPFEISAGNDGGTTSAGCCASASTAGRERIASANLCCPPERVRRSCNWSKLIGMRVLDGFVA
jgi:hypothetical protein